MEEQKFYLTKQGLEKIQKERDKLMEFKRLKTKDDVPSIWHSEDVNPEYLAFQEDMTLLETKLVEYENILKNVELITMPRKDERDTVQLGATVSIDFDGEIDEFTLVGTLEADPVNKKISSESPIGQGLLGKRAGSSVVVKASVVNHTCKILKIRYSK